MDRPLHLVCNEWDKGSNDHLNTSNICGLRRVNRTFSTGTGIFQLRPSLTHFRLIFLQQAQPNKRKHTILINQVCEFIPGPIQT